MLDAAADATVWGAVCREFDSRGADVDAATATINTQHKMRPSMQQFPVDPTGGMELVRGEAHTASPAGHEA